MSREPLHIAMRKYGNHVFNIKEIDACNQSDLIEKTEYWIGRYKPEYNEEFAHLDDSVEDTPKTFVIKQKEDKKPKNLPTFTDENRGTGKHSGIRIQSMNIETGELKEWENARVAAAEIAGNPNRNANILKSARKGYISYGHRWKLLEHKTKKKPVKGIHKITWEEIYFESKADAIRHLGNGTHGSRLTVALKSKGKYTWRGYMWFYV